MLPNIAFFCGEGCNSHTHTHFASHDTVAQAVGPQQATCCPQLASPSDRTCTPAALSSWSLCLQCTHTTQQLSTRPRSWLWNRKQHKQVRHDVKVQAKSGWCRKTVRCGLSPLAPWPLFPVHSSEVVMVFWYPGNDIYLPASQGDAVKGIHMLLLTSTKEYVGKGVQVEITLKVCWSRYPGGDTNPRSVLQTVSRCWYSLVYGVYWRSI